MLRSVEVVSHQRDKLIETCVFSTLANGLTESA